VATLPAYRLSGRIARLDVEALCRPLPPAAVEELDPDLVAQHQRLAQRYGEARARQVAAEQELAKAETADRVAAEKAIAAGRKLPAPKMPAVQAEAEEAEREVQVTGDLVRTSAGELLTAALPVAGQLEGHAADVGGELEQRGLQLLVDARQEFQVAAESAAAASWLNELRTTGSVAPWSNRIASTEPMRAVDQALAAVEHALRRRIERTEAGERAAFAANRVRRGDVLVELPEPPAGEGVERWELPGSAKPAA
jgi:hypothetical protein